MVDNGSNDAYGIASLVLSKTDFNCSDIATNPNTVILTVTDNNGNVSTATSQVTVTDAINPTVVTQDITVQLDANGTVSITPSQVNNVSTDNCAIATYALDNVDFTCDDLGENTVTLTVTDVYGNNANDTAVITVVDTIAPVLESQNVTLALDENGAGVITTTDVVLERSDNCGTPTVSIDRTNFDCANLGDYSVTVTALDAGGNTTSRTATVTVTGPDNDGDFLSDACDPDDDNDGTDDDDDDFPNDPNEDKDTDVDGTGDNEDAFPNDPNEDTDTDGDGTGDNEDCNDRLEQEDGIARTGADRQHIYLAGGYDFDLGNNMVLKPTVLLRYVDAAPLSVYLTSRLAFSENFELGAAYRINESFSGLFIFNVSKVMQIGYAYEFANSSSVRNIDNGTHEIMMNLKL